MALNLKIKMKLKLKTMKLLKQTFLLFLVMCFASSCNTDNNHSSGNGAVIEGSNKDDRYQRNGYVDSIPSDSIREEKRLDSIRISKSPDHNK
jgi:hypothetical protein